MKKYFAFVLAVMLLGVIASSCCAANITVQGRVPEGRVGQSYNATFTASGATGIGNWNFRGTIPGLTFSSSGFSGALTGIPSSAGEFSCSITVTDNSGNSSDPFQFTVKINERGSDSGGNDNPGGNTGGTLAIDGHLAASVVGRQYPVNSYGTLLNVATVSGGTPPYKWSVVKGDLPKGTCLACSPTGTGYQNNELVGPYTVLSGIPVLGGDYDFTLSVTDSKGQVATKDFSVGVGGNNYDELEIHGEFEGANIVYTYINAFDYYKKQGGFVDAGGRAPYRWSKVGGELPEGLTLKTIENVAVLDGIPQRVAEYRFVLKVTDADGRTATKNYAIQFNNYDENADMPVYGSYTIDESIPEISGTFVAGEAGKAYSGSVLVSNGVAPYTWSIVYGELPEGVSLGKTGTQAQITGTPASEGYYNFTLKVVDSLGNTDAKSCVLKVTGSASNSTPDSGNNGNNDNSGNNSNNNGNNNTNNNNNSNNGNNNSNNNSNQSSGGGGGGGCDSGISVLALAVLAAFTLSHKK